MESKLNHFQSEARITNQIKLKGIKEKFASLGSTIKATAKVAAGFAVGVGAVGAGALAAANKSAAAADEIDKMSQKIGISRDAYQELAFAFSQSGTDVNNLQTGMKTLTNAAIKASEGTTTFAESFNALGVSVNNADGSMKTRHRSCLAEQGQN